MPVWPGCLPTVSRIHWIRRFISVRAVTGNRILLSIPVIYTRCGFVTPELRYGLMYNWPIRTRNWNVCLQGLFTASLRVLFLIPMLMRLMMDRSVDIGWVIWRIWNRNCMNGNGKSTLCVIPCVWLINIGRWPVMTVFLMKSGYRPSPIFFVHLRSSSAKRVSVLTGLSVKRTVHSIPWLTTD